MALKVAVTEVAAFMVTLQAPVPLQAPLQPANAEPGAGVAAKLTIVPLAKLAEQVAPQEIPAGELVTVPVPVPVSVTVRVWDTDFAIRGRPGRAQRTRRVRKRRLIHVSRGSRHRY